MAVEIERKFIVKGDSWKSDVINKYTCVQGYFNKSPDLVVRVRIISDKAFITIKSKSVNFSRNEYEYPIPLSDAKELLTLCKYKIFKDRYTIKYDQYEWIIDVFKDDNSGLILAEIELDNENQTFDLPIWIESEVSLDMRYTNLELAINPFNKK